MKLDNLCFACYCTRYNETTKSHDKIVEVCNKWPSPVVTGSTDDRLILQLVPCGLTAQPGMPACERTGTVQALEQFPNN